MYGLAIALDLRLARDLHGKEERPSSATSKDDRPEP